MYVCGGWCHHAVSGEDNKINETFFQFLLRGPRKLVEANPISWLPGTAWQARRHTDTDRPAHSSSSCRSVRKRRPAGDDDSPSMGWLADSRWGVCVCWRCSLLTRRATPWATWTGSASSAPTWWRRRRASESGTTCSRQRARSCRSTGQVRSEGGWREAMSREAGTRAWTTSHDDA